MASEARGRGGGGVLSRCQLGNRKWGGDAARLDKDAAEHFGVLRRSGDVLVSACRAWSPSG